VKLFYIAAGANDQGMTDGIGKLVEGAGLLSADSAAMPEMD